MESRAVLGDTAGSSDTDKEYYLELVLSRYSHSLSRRLSPALTPSQFTATLDIRRDQNTIRGTLQSNNGPGRTQSSGQYKTV